LRRIFPEKNFGANVTGPEFFLHEPVLPGFFLLIDPMRTPGRVWRGQALDCVADPSSIARTDGTEQWPGHRCMISTTRATIAVIASSFRCPAVYWMILLSAVKIRVGRTLLSWRSDPDEKSASLTRIA
jgi:hypothetical protein